MITWTNSARTRLESHLTQMRATLLASGADPNEVTDDLRRHIDQEAHARQVGVVTTEDVDRILGGMGMSRASSPLAELFAPPAGDLPPAGSKNDPLPPPQPMASHPSRPERQWHRWLLFFGVALPLIALAIEALTHMCAATTTARPRPRDQLGKGSSS